MKMSLALFALVFTSSVSAYDFRCITQEEAVQAANLNLESVRKDLHDESSFWIPRQKIREYVSRIDFLESENVYKTAYLAKWTCAAGSDCYVGVQVSCAGEVSTYMFAD
ncbi:MAG: hypothetical protein K2Q18_11710 [Bdellovibrionales bacterium]|nr:hypothetical protein [Bdellovibrionales bacterium]